MFEGKTFAANHQTHLTDIGECARTVGNNLGQQSFRSIPGYKREIDRRDCVSTNLGSEGLASADRNNKATLLLTAPCPTIKSYAKDLFPRMVKLQYASKVNLVSRGTPGASLLRFRAEAYSYSSTMCGSKNYRFLAWILT
jgi:hypothetical protein